MTEQPHRPAPHRQSTGTDASHVHQLPTTPRGEPHQPDPRQPEQRCAERRRRQGPPAAPRSGSARALTPPPHRRAHKPGRGQEEGPANTLDRPRSFRDDLRKRCATSFILAHRPSFHGHQTDRRRTGRTGHESRWRTGPPGRGGPSARIRGPRDQGPGRPADRLGRGQRRPTWQWREVGGGVGRMPTGRGRLTCGREDCRTAGHKSSIPGHPRMRSCGLLQESGY